MVKFLVTRGGESQNSRQEATEGETGSGWEGERQERGVQNNRDWQEGEGPLWFVVGSGGRWVEKEKEGERDPWRRWRAEEGS